MNAATLRRAAAQIRNDHGGIVSRTTLDGRRWLPVADLLDSAADEWDAGHQPIAYVGDVAHAYLGESS